MYITIHGRRSRLSTSSVKTTVASKKKDRTRKRGTVAAAASRAIAPLASNQITAAIALAKRRILNRRLGHAAKMPCMCAQ